MASAKENVRVPVAPQPLPRQTSSSSSRPPPPLRPKMANGATKPTPVSGVLKCTCFRLPSRTKKPLLPPPPAPKLSNASRSRSAVAPDVSASLSTWWPSSPSAASAGAAATANNPAPAGSVGSVLSPRRVASARSLSSSRVMPRSECASFSFAVSPAASASSSCMSTPKIPQGRQQK